MIDDNQITDTMTRSVKLYTGETLTVTNLPEQWESTFKLVQKRNEDIKTKDVSQAQKNHWADFMWARIEILEEVATVEITK